MQTTFVDITKDDVSRAERMIYCYWGNYGLSDLQVRCICKQAERQTLRIPISMHLRVVNGRSNRGDLRGRQLHVQRAHVLLKVLDFPGAMLYSRIRVTSNSVVYEVICEEYTYPGIGKISSPCAINHVSVSCPAVTPFSTARRFSSSTTCKFLGKLSLENLGKKRRTSVSSKSSGLLYCPVRKPRERGE